ncbi:MAG: orotidine-5'-phosphate decarboxylase [Actinomycetia bacterium]|nr:orotidine-5'-phosphate decarboxylase [Actinomycetes bacterium]MCP4958907.1 orotidine-5'-phosphate decarboxylase [Actinomycetes bacterium]
MTEVTATAVDVRDRLALALDVDDIVAAARIARQMQPYFGVAKVGLELFSANGPDAVGALADMGYDVFLDVKLHDIPNTVEKASRVLGALGVRYLTLHAFGGADMLRAGVEGLASGAERAGLPSPTALAVTILTSDDGAPPHILPKRVQVALEGGCGGIVCAASDVKEARQYAPRLDMVVPGIRMAGTSAHDQARVATPADAISSGADLLVIGRAVTAADDPVAAAEAINEEVRAAI